MFHRREKCYSSGARFSSSAFVGAWSERIFLQRVRDVRCCDSEIEFNLGLGTILRFVGEMRNVLQKKGDGELMLEMVKRYKLMCFFFCC